MDQARPDFADRIEALEREVSQLKVKLAALSYNPERVRDAVDGYLALRDEVSAKWKGVPSVVDEVRKNRRLG